MPFNVTLGAALHGETPVYKTKVGGRRHGTMTAIEMTKLGGRCRHTAFDARLGMDMLIGRDSTPTVVLVATCLCVVLWGGGGVRAGC